MAQLKATGTVLADHILCYRLLKSANLSDFELLLVKATTSTMTYAEVKKQLLRVFDNIGAEKMGQSLAPGARVKEEFQDSEV